jgi:predicted nucleotidyltransferase
MIYSLEQIKELVEPIAQKYKLKTLWVFGSYARGEPTDDSDIDLLMDFTDLTAKNLRGFVNMAEEFEQILDKKVDLISINSLYCHIMKKYFYNFMNIVSNEKVMLY